MSKPPIPNKSLGQLGFIDGVPHVLIDRLREKHSLLAVGDPSHGAIKTTLIIGGGGMRGVYSTGVTAALEEMEMGDVFDDAIGISAGACAVAYMLAGQAAVGPSVYYDDLPNKQFINTLRPKNIMDIQYLEQVFRDKKPLDQAAIRRARTPMHVGLTEVSTGKGVYMNMSEHPGVDIISAVIASSALPGVAKQQPALDGCLYADGTTGCTEPIQYAIDSLQATDILIVMNYPFRSVEKLPFAERIIDPVILRKFPKEFRTAHVQRLDNHSFKSSRRYDETVNIGVLYPSRQYVGPLSKNSVALRGLADYAARQTKAIFAEPNHD